MVNLLADEVISSKAESVGFVYPNYLHVLPKPVEKFIKKIDVKSAEYIFTVETRSGSVSRSPIIINNILKTKGKKLNSCFFINMPVNCGCNEKGYKKPTKDQLDEIEKNAQAKIHTIKDIVINRRNNKGEDNDVILKDSLLKKIIFYPLGPLGTHFIFRIWETIVFYPDAKCTGCGTCEKVCLSKKIKMEKNKPVWQNNIKCYSCLACINYCPVQAIQIKSKWLYNSYTTQNERYNNPYIKADDIAQQKKREYD